MSFELLKSHLRTPFITAFAYGSGVFRQSCGTAGKMIDYLVVVDEVRDWHAENSKINPPDYTVLGRVALKTVPDDSVVYYVPDVQVNGKRIKYGVVGWDTLMRDLYTWDFMFLAGRLHKPTLVDEDGMCLLRRNELYRAMERNFDSALNAALLLTPNPTDFKSTLRSLVSLSYTRDPRLLLAESPRKIENIVEGQMGELERIYLGRWEGLEGKKMLGDPVMRLKLINDLPLSLKSELLKFNGYNCDLWSVALNPTPAPLINAIGRMVNRSAWRQMILGAISASPSTAVGYVLSKMKKRFSH